MLPVDCPLGRIGNDNLACASPEKSHYKPAQALRSNGRFRKPLAVLRRSRVRTRARRKTTTAPCVDF